MVFQMAHVRGLKAMVVKKSEPLIDSVYARLRDLILSNVLRAGQKLVDRDLAEQLGVSRTPIREALGRLAMMGLVEARSRRGYYVKQYTAGEMTDLYDFRRILEVSAARLAAQNAQPDQLREFERILAESEKLAANPSNHARTVELDLEIHSLVARASGNTALHQAIQNLMDKVTCFIWVDWVDSATADAASIAAAHSEHKELIERIMDKDADGAAERLGSHIDNAREGLATLIKARDDLRSVVLSGTTSN
jgi:DNA-binding GntR family transcriptional regulator